MILPTTHAYPLVSLKEINQQAQDRHGNDPRLPNNRTERFHNQEEQRQAGHERTRSKHTKNEQNANKGGREDSPWKTTKGRDSVTGARAKASTATVPRTAASGYEAIDAEVKLEGRRRRGTLCSSNLRRVVVDTHQHIFKNLTLLNCRYYLRNERERDTERESVD